VVVLGLEQGNSPHEYPKSHERLLEWRKIVQILSHATWRAPMTHEHLQRLYEQEEKRIFYVAMTRAKYNLVVSRAEKRSLNRRTRRYNKSDFLSLSHDPKLVKEASSPFEIQITAPERPKAEEGYRSDGRVFETKCGVLVRSKSEMLLANEFTGRGMYFEYEEADPAVPDALPDFSFPDYGRVVLEHLGLLDDPNYVERWNKKAKAYEEQGIRYFRTNEEEIKILANTVDRLQEQFRNWIEKQYDSERVQMIDLIETLRRKSDFIIGRSIGDFGDGTFEVDDSGEGIVVILIPRFVNISGEETEADDVFFDRKIPGYGELLWEENSLNDIRFMIGSLMEDK